MPINISQEKIWKVALGLFAAIVCLVVICLIIFESDQRASLIGSFLGSSFGLAAILVAAVVNTELVRRRENDTLLAEQLALFRNIRAQMNWIAGALVQSRLGLVKLSNDTKSADWVWVNAFFELQEYSQIDNFIFVSERTTRLIGHLHDETLDDQIFTQITRNTHHNQMLSIYRRTHAEYKNLPELSQVRSGLQESIAEVLTSYDRLIECCQKTTDIVETKVSELEERE